MPRAERKTFKNAEEIVDEINDHADAIMQLELCARELTGQQQRAFADLYKKFGGQRMAEINDVRKNFFANDKEAEWFGHVCLSLSGDPAVSQRSRDRISELSRTLSMGETSGEAGALPVEFSNRLHTLVEKYGAFTRNVQTIPIIASELNFKKLVSDVEIFNLTENVAAPATQPTFADVNLIPKEWGGITYFPNNLNEDMAGWIAAVVVDSYARGWAKKNDMVGFFGDASSSSFGVRGIVPKLTALNGVDDGGGLVLAAGNAWSEITLDNLEDLVAIAPDYVESDAAFYCHRTFFFKVMARRAIAAGGVTAGEIMGQRRPMFAGYPVEFCPAFPKTQANSQIPVVFGSLSRAATLGTRKQYSITTSRDYKFAERQTALLVTGRQAINVHDLGSATEAGPMVGLVTAAA